MNRSLRASRLRRRNSLIWLWSGCWLLVAGQHAEGQILVARPLDLAGRDGAHAVGVEQQEHRLRLHPRIESLLASGILGLSGDQDLREIELINQVQQDIHLVVF